MLYNYCSNIFRKWNKSRRTKERLLLLTENTEHLVKPRTYPIIVSSSIRNTFIFFFSEALQPKSGPDRLIVEVSRTHTDTPHLVGPPWMRDQSVVETSTWKHTTFTETDIDAPCGIRTRSANNERLQTFGWPEIVTSLQQWQKQAK